MSAGSRHSGSRRSRVSARNSEWWRISGLRMKLRHEIEPYWQNEDDWLCTIEFLPGDDPEGRLFGADIVAYLFGYAQLTNTRVLALVGDPNAGAYELLFSFSSAEEKNKFLSLVRSNEDMG